MFGNNYVWYQVSINRIKDLYDWVLNNLKNKNILTGSWPSSTCSSLDCCFLA